MVWNRRISSVLIYSVAEVWIAIVGSLKALAPDSSPELPIQENTSSVAMQRYQPYQAVGQYEFVT